MKHTHIPPEIKWIQTLINLVSMLSNPFSKKELPYTFVKFFHLPSSLSSPFRYLPSPYSSRKQISSMTLTSLCLLPLSKTLLPNLFYTHSLQYTSSATNITYPIKIRPSAMPATLINLCICTQCKNILSIRTNVELCKLLARINHNLHPKTCCWLLSQLETLLQNLSHTAK